ncbi:MAG: hypothetical protein LC808_38385 [Actinobacteria bacterium]|nr:hypothetical protein [Actinomycetota bacterium]
MSDHELAALEVDHGDRCDVCPCDDGGAVDSSALLLSTVLDRVPLREISPVAARPHLRLNLGKQHRDRHLRAGREGSGRISILGFGK